MSEIDLTAITEVETHAWDPQGERAELEEPRRRARPPVISILAFAYLAIVILAAIFAPLVAPHNPNLVNVLNEFHRPSWGTNLLGTDELGRDELSRLIYGARVSLLAALIGTGVALIVGAPLGILAGYTRGAVESVSNFLFDALMSMPAIVFALAVLAVLGSGLTNAMVAIGIVISPVFFRLARSATLDVRSETFIEASVVIGCRRRRIILRHIVPNALTPILVQAAIISGVCIVAEAGISFLGFGVKPPTASWGAMLFNAQENLSQDPWLVYLPGIAIALTVLSLSLVGDWLRHLLSVSRRPGGA
jgi:peptide/nickel transport system permease protein